MDTLLLALLACVLGETGGRMQRLAGLLDARFGRPAALLLGAACAAAALAALAAAAGAYLLPMLSPEARLLFLALALLTGGATMLWRSRAPDSLSGWRIGPFLTAFLGLLILGFGDSAMFLLVALAAARAEPLWAGVGGAIGLWVGIALAVLLPASLMAGPRWLLLQRATGAGFVLLGLGAAVSALGLA